MAQAQVRVAVPGRLCGQGDAALAVWQALSAVGRSPQINFQPFRTGEGDTEIV